MVECGCPPVQDIILPTGIPTLCEVPEPDKQIIAIETHTETTNKNCFNALAVGFSIRYSCGGMGCGE